MPKRSADEVQLPELKLAQLQAPDGPPEAARQAACDLRFVRCPYHPQLAQRGEFLDRRAQRIDLGVGVGRRQLDPEADVGLRHEREGCERHVDASVEQHPPDRVDPAMVSQRDLDDREPGAVRRVHSERGQAVQHAPGVSVQDAA